MKIDGRAVSDLRISGAGDDYRGLPENGHRHRQECADSAATGR